LAALEKTFLRIGVIPLADAAPLVVAQQKGFFERQGLEVELTLERAWAAVRDKVAAERLDAAHMLAPMPLAATLGLDSVQTPMLTALTLNLNGNAIVVSNSLHSRLAAMKRTDEAGAIGWARAFRRVIEADRATGRPALVLAHVYPFSNHHYELRYWLGAAGIDADHDLNLIVVPPPQMVTQLEAGRIDGFCVGAPWGEMAELLGIGRRIVSKYQIWNNSPEKVLGVTRAWAESHPQTHIALITALIEAGRWLDQPGNRKEAARLMVEGRWLDAPMESVQQALGVRPEGHEFGPGMTFHAGAAGFPWVSQALWLLKQIRHWHRLPAHVDANDVAGEVFRPDLYRAAAERIGVNAPLVDFKTEGSHARPWLLDGAQGAISMGPDCFLDGAHFPDDRGVTLNQPA
jgi:nitrate/nitrite transport system substrate-binding protein